MKNESLGTSALVLARGATGLAVIRSLGQAGVDVHAFVFDPEESLRRSRYCKHVELIDPQFDEVELIRKLIDYSHSFDDRPTLFPTSDALTLLLARHAEALTAVCRIFNNSSASLAQIVYKDGLYASATRAGVATIPSIVSNRFEDIVKWSNVNSAPYLIKPFYEGLESARLKSKNLSIGTRDELLDYVRAEGSESVVVQRLLRGGDGYIFDSYGLCDRNGAVRILASHRRIRQQPPDFGATCYGEIPAEPTIEKQIFASTRQLFSHLRYHGIFGIEWLYERDSGCTYLIDFNARPFTTLGHLTYCGLNLALLAHTELTAGLPPDFEYAQPLMHAFWVDFGRDLDSFYTKLNRNEISTGAWLWSLLITRSFAYVSWRDPGPGIASFFRLFRRIVRSAFRRCWPEKRR